MKDLALFKTTRDAIRAERICKKSDILCKVVPVPRNISSECGMALEIEEENSGLVTEIFDSEGISYSIYKK